MKRLILLAVILFALLPGTAKADHLMCGQPQARTLSVYYDGSDPNIYWWDILWALNTWNEFSGWAAGRPVFQWWDGYGSPDVVVTTDTQTWVWTDCNQFSVYFLGTSHSRDFKIHWMLHEFGHTLKFADHILPGTNPAGYVNPGGQNGYNGLMNYADDPLTFTWDDVTMILDWWY